MSIMSDDDFVRLFQRTFGLTEDGWAGRDSEAKLRELATLAGIAFPAIPVSEIPTRSMRYTNIRFPPPTEVGDVRFRVIRPTSGFRQEANFANRPIADTRRSDG